MTVTTPPDPMPPGGLHSGGTITEPGAVETAVLDAAVASLLAVGVRRTTLTDVARRAGVSRMTLYRRWPDLRSLVSDVMTREWTRIVTVAARDAQPSVAAGTRAGLVHYLVTTVRTFQTNPLFRKIVDTDPELLVPYILDRLGATQLLVLDLLRNQLAAAQATGAVRAGDPAAQARMVLLTVQSFVLSAGALGDEVAPEAMMRELQLMLDGYLAPPTDGDGRAAGSTAGPIAGSTARSTAGSAAGSAGPTPAHGRSGQASPDHRPVDHPGAPS